MATPFMQVRAVGKRFPGVVVLAGVNLSIDSGEVLGLIGENGAGKSTLMKILGGIFPPDEGEILIDGRAVSLKSASDASKMGIAFIHQELTVLENLDVAANIYLGREPVWGGALRLVDQGKIRRDSIPYLRQLGLDVSTSAMLKNLSLAQKQLVEIARALSQNARLLIMDEPTSSLTLTETRRLLRTIAELKAKSVSVIYISHRLAEIQESADRVEALRDGRNAGSLKRGEISHDAMVKLMVGRDLASALTDRRKDSEDVQAGLEVRNLVTRAHPGKRISFAAKRGEILGFAGLIGAGRSEMAQAIFGFLPPISGEIFLDGEPLRAANPSQAIEAGIFLVPEDRRKSGLLTEMTIRENITLAKLRRFARFGLVSRSRERAVAGEQMRSLNIRAPGIETRTRNLSGGNQQKVVLGRWLALKPKVLIVDEPTRGIDVGAKAEIYRLLRSLADSGVAIVMISSEMEEVLAVSDRIAVMHEGEVRGILLPKDFSEDAVIRLAVGEASGSGEAA
jgi:ribose transport system ATP-binding protein